MYIPSVSTAPSEEMKRTFDRFQDASYPHLWSIVLAGGDGVRLRPLIERWQRRQTPKQYCTFVGTRSMIQHTLDRADRLGSPDQQLTVITRSHLQIASPHLSDRPTGTIISQPANCDTAAGIFLPLAHIRARDPQATVVVYPSDHFIHPEERVVDVVASAVQAAEDLSDRIVLLGVQPEEPEREYGWIQPGLEIGSWSGHSVRAVRNFVEKPSQAQANACFAAGGLWNTLVFAAKADTLWDLGWRCFPEVMVLFEWLSEVIGTKDEAQITEELYAAMPKRNFSSDLLARVTDKVAVVKLSSVLWSDWGQPERIADTLQRIGKKPAFPLECLEAIRAVRHARQAH